MEQEKSTKNQETDDLKRWVELIITIIMSIATVAAAWSSFQAARWGGVMITNFNHAAAKRTDSMRYYLSAGQLTNLDIFIFNEWLVATYEENTDLADFYYQRMRDDFRPALDAWLDSKPLINPDAAPSPFAMVDYSLPELEQSIQLEQEASQLYTEGLAANQQSDDYVANTVILASVLFFAGISTRFKRYSAQIIMIILAAGLLIDAVYNIIAYPIY